MHNKLYYILFLLLITLQFSLSEDVTCIGDLHGDYQNTLAVLKMCNLISNTTEPTWTGGNRTLIQIGDILDRGPFGLKILQLFQKLMKEANAAGGKVIVLLGNHEALNARGLFHYVNKQEMSMKYVNAMKSSGSAWKFITSLDTAIIIDKILYVHAGLTVKYASKGIEYVNSKMRKVLKSGKKKPILGKHGPVWDRFIARGPEEASCFVLNESLRKVNATRMIVGHTVQKNGKINYRCKKKLVLIDVGISTYYGGNLAAIRIIDGGPIQEIYPQKEMIKDEL